MTRATAWLVVLALVTGTLCHAQESPALKPLPDDEKKPAAKTDESGTKAKTGDEKSKELPGPSLLPDAKKPSTKTDQAGTKAKTGDEKTTTRPAPNLFPSPPFPPAAPPVYDPRTHAWEQIVADSNVVSEVGAPQESPGAVVVAGPRRTRMTLGYWLQQFKARCTGERTIELSKDSQSGEWHISEVPPGR